MRLALQAFDVIMGALILGGAVNTAIVGSNGVLNRVTEDGILPPWFKGLHKKYGTTHRIVNLVALLQAGIIIASRGDVFLLGEAYAFGVLWSFCFTALSVTVLRYKDRSPREWRVPGNIRFGATEVPLGLIIITLVLFATAVTNFLTKTTATKAGLLFTGFLFTVFFITDRWNRSRRGLRRSAEHFNLLYKDNIRPETLKLEHRQRLLFAVRDPNNLGHLIKRLEKLHGDADVVVLSSRYGRAFQMKGDQVELTTDEHELFANVVSVAEKYGRDVIPVMVPTNDPIYSIAKTAVDTRATEIIVGASKKMPPDIQMEQLAMAWGSVHPPEARPVTLRIISETHELKCDLI
jgi:hypothetical protein